MESIAKNLDKIAPYAMVISNNKNEIDTLTKKLNEQRQLKNKLEVQLTEIKHTQEDIENTVNKIYGLKPKVQPLVTT